MSSGSAGGDGAGGGGGGSCAVCGLSIFCAPLPTLCSSILLQAISVGDVDFRFNALPEECCDLLHLPLAASGEGPAIVGAVRQKLMVQRNIQDERGRVRARAEEAERQGNERKAQLLHGKPAAGKAGKAGTTTTLRRATPPPQQPQQLRSTPPPLAGRPPTHPASTLTAAGRGPIQPQPAAAAAARPPLKSASAPKLAGGGATLQQTASPLVLQAARSSGGNNLRLCLIAMLSERAMPKGAVMSGGCLPNSLPPRGVVCLPAHACRTAACPVFAATAVLCASLPA